MYTVCSFPDKHTVSTRSRTDRNPHFMSTSASGIMLKDSSCGLPRYRWARKVNCSSPDLEISTYIIHPSSFFVSVLFCPPRGCQVTEVLGRGHMSLRSHGKKEWWSSGVFRLWPLDPRPHVSTGLGTILFGVSGSWDDREVTSLPEELPREPDSEKDTWQRRESKPGVRMWISCWSRNTFTHLSRPGL